MNRQILFIMLIILLKASYSYAEVNPWKESYRLEQAYQYDSAINALNTIDSNNELAVLRRGWLNYLKGSYSRSIDFYTKALKINSVSLDARLGLTLPLLEQQRWREAALHANKALEKAPWNYFAHIRLMQTEQALKQWQQLSIHAQAVHPRYPSDATILLYVARASDKLGDSKQAKLFYNKVLELFPDHFEAKHYLQ